MRNIGKQNHHLRDILPLEYSSPNINPGKLKAFIKQLGKIPGEHPRSGEILQEMYGFFVRNKAASLKNKEEVAVTPVSIEDLPVSMLSSSPMKDPIFDPCCGYGGLLTAVGRFAEIFNEPIEIIKVYGQEKNVTHYRLCCMGLAMYRLYINNVNNVKYNNESSLDKEIHNRLQAKTILCAPSGDSNYFSWIQYALSHLAPGGHAGLVLPKRSLNTKTGNEDQIRENLLENKSVDCIVSLPGKLFYGKGIPACLWILAKEKENSQGPCRRPNDEVLFIDAGYKEPVINQELSEKMIQYISITYRQWREKSSDYSDVKGFCKSVCSETIKAKNYDLSPKLYI
jgi:type I restriction enzyme M protein